MIDKKGKPPPPVVGMQKSGNLQACIDGKPHCFSSTFVEVDTSKIGRDWITKPWTYKGKSVLGAFEDLKKTVDAYPPGQGGIDEGGFKVTKVQLPNAPDEPAYLWVQFEARQGYIDDVEFLLRDGVVQVRTTSRVGYLDYGVNAKRYNWFAKRVGSLSGWTTEPVRLKEHLEYAELNDLSSDGDLGL